MAILLILPNRDTSAWVEQLHQLLPETSVEVYPEVKDPAAIEFIISMRPDKEQVDLFQNTKVIHCIGAGVNYIVDAGIITENILLARIVDPFLTKDMFEFLLAVVTSNLKNLNTYQQFQKRQNWNPLSYKRFPDTQIAILGLGQIGAYVAIQFAALGFQVTGWSNSEKSIENVKSYVGEDGLKVCLSKADFLINILPLTAATKFILNRQVLGHLPKGAYLINVGRGNHNQEQDILELLDTGHLSGALLDVFKEEPLPVNHPFWHHPKMQVTPHIASLSNPQSVVAQIVDNYKRFVNGETLLNLVDLDKGY